MFWPKIFKIYLFFALAFECYGDAFAESLFSESDILFLKMYQENAYLISKQKIKLKESKEDFFRHLIKNSGEMLLLDLKKEREINIWELREKADYDALFFRVLERF